MSSTFDTMQQALATLSGDHDVITKLRFCIDRLHEMDHEQGGALNRYAGRSATRLEEAMADADAARTKRP